MALSAGSLILRPDMPDALTCKVQYSLGTTYDSDQRWQHLRPVARILPVRPLSQGAADVLSQPKVDMIYAAAALEVFRSEGGEPTFAALVTNGSSAQIATFAKSSDLAAWRALHAVGAQGKAALRRTCSRRTPLDVS